MASVTRTRCKGKKKPTTNRNTRKHSWEIKYIIPERKLWIKVLEFRTEEIHRINSKNRISILFINSQNRNA